MRVEPTESGRRWRLVCSCGLGLPKWPGDTPPTCATETAAQAKGIWHWKQETAKLRELRRMGLGPRVHHSA
jgi:hypothetical protein